MKRLWPPAVLLFVTFGVLSAQQPPAPEKVRFGGLDWQVKDSGGRPVGPGPNKFSADNVSVEPNGKLHLRVAGADDDCVAAEVIASPALGYGTYRFTVDANLDSLAKNLVLGLFVWDDTSVESFHREIDIEIGRWNQEGNDDAQFVIQPYSIPRNIVRFSLPRSLTASIHSFTWAPDRASFRSEGILPSGEKRLIAEHVFDRMIPEPGKEQARINLWCVDSKAPSEGLTEVVVSNFRFTPLP